MRSYFVTKIFRVTPYCFRQDSFLFTLPLRAFTVSEFIFPFDFYNTSMVLLCGVAS